MKIACTLASGRGETDQLLFNVATRLQTLGIRVCGTVQVNTEKLDDRKCDMDVKVLPHGPLLRISQSLGRGSRGCRLDADALETAVGLVGASLRNGAECLIINKFGKQEAEGAGFRDVIASALSLGMPVLVGLNQLNRNAFFKFSGGLAETLAPDADLLEDWLIANLETLSVAV